MIDIISAILGVLGILFILIPISIFIFVLFFVKADVDHDGKEDNKWIWEK
jgi:uncharacterized membrane protein